MFIIGKLISRTLDEHIHGAIFVSVKIHISFQELHILSILAR